MYFRQLLSHEKYVCQNGRPSGSAMPEAELSNKVYTKWKSVAEMVKDFFRTSDVFVFPTLLTKVKEMKD